MDEARNTGNIDVQKKAGFGFNIRNFCRVDNGGCRGTTAGSFSIG